MILSIRCSSLDKVLTCSGSRTLEAKVAAATEDVFGGGDGGHAVQWAGSWCHHHAAVRLRDEFGAVGIPDPLTIPATFKPSSYDEWVVNWYVGRVTSLIPSDWPMFIERELKRVFPLRTPFYIHHPHTREQILVDQFELTGHIDHSAVSPCGTRAVIDDLKRGYDIVDAAEFNWQLAGYCALLKGEIPTLNETLLRIHQPAAPDRTTEAAVTNIDALVSSLERHINDAFEAPYTFNSGKACKYCDALLICSTFRKDRRTMRETLTKEFIDSLPAVASTAELGELALNCRKLDYPSKRVIEAFRTRLDQEGGEVQLPDGTIAKILEEDGAREITDVQFAHEELSRKTGATAAWRTLTMGIGKVEEELAATGMQKTSKKKDVETAKSWVDNNLGGVITRKKQKTLVFV